MIKMTPRVGFGLVLGFLAIYLGAVWLGRAGAPDLQLVRPDARGVVRIEVASLGREEVRFYRFLNAANQEVEFLVGRDENGVLQVGFNAGESHYKLRRGFSYQDGFIIDNKCETTSRLSELNQGGGGCKPIPLRHRVVGDQLVLQESDLLEGWRYFR